MRLESTKQLKLKSEQQRIQWGIFIIVKNKMVGIWKCDTNERALQASN